LEKIKNIDWKIKNSTIIEIVENLSYITTYKFVDLDLQKKNWNQHQRNSVQIVLHNGSLTETITSLIFVLVIPFFSYICQGIILHQNNIY